MPNHVRCEQHQTNDPFAAIATKGTSGLSTLCENSFLHGGFGGADEQPQQRRERLKIAAAWHARGFTSGGISCGRGM